MNGTVWSDSYDHCEGLMVRRRFAGGGEDMAVQVTCPECGVKAEIRDALVGKVRERWIGAASN